MQYCRRHAFASRCYDPESEAYFASIHETKAGFAIPRRCEGRQFNQTPGTDTRPKAEALASRVEETIRALTEGWLKLPDGADHATVKQSTFTRGVKTSLEKIE